jgi:hypothetical protein
MAEISFQLPLKGLSSHLKSNGVAFPLIIQAFSCDVSKGGVLTPEQTTKLSSPLPSGNPHVTRCKQKLCFFTSSHSLSSPLLLLSALPGMKHDASGSKTTDAGSVTERERERARETEIRCHGNKRKVHVGQIPMGTVS